RGPGAAPKPGPSEGSHGCLEGGPPRVRPRGPGRHAPGRGAADHLRESVMATAAPAPAPTRARPARRGGARAALLGPIVLLVLGFDAGCGALVFALAGTIYLPWFWAALGLFAALHVASAAVVL